MIMRSCSFVTVKRLSSFHKNSISTSAKPARKKYALIANRIMERAFLVESKERSWRRYGMNNSRS